MKISKIQLKLFASIPKWGGLCIPCVKPLTSTSSQEDVGAWRYVLVAVHSALWKVLNFEWNHKPPYSGIEVRGVD